MGIPLRVLIVEDVEDDAELLVQELRSKGYDPLYERVDTQKAMLEALDRQTWDVIICDYSMPGFNAISALKLMRKIHNDLPFILVSGAIGEEIAVDALKAGAHDYIMKNNLPRFVPAIEREMAEYKERRRVRQMEEELQKSEQHHRKLLNSLKEGVYQCEPHVDGVFTWVNQACAEIFGYKSPEEMIGTKVKDIYADTEERRRLVEELEKDGALRNFESLCKKKNGEQIYTERTSNMIRDEKGNLECIEGVIRDITEHQQMEEAIQTLVKGTVGVTGQAFFDRIVSSMCEWLGTEYAFIGNIEDGKTVRALSMKVDGKNISDYVYDLNGTPCEKAVESGCCIYPEGVSKLFPDGKDLIEKNVEGYVGVSLKDKNGKAVGMLWTASRHKINIPPRMIEVMEIISAKASAEIERMQTEADLQKSEEKYRAVFEQSVSSNVVVDGDTGEIVEFNTHAHENLGFTRKEFEDLKIADIDIIENDEDVRKHIERVIKIGSDIFETKHKGKDGKIHDMIISAKCLSIPGRNLVSSIWLDITERKKAEEQIKASLREKEVLLKEIHHRVKNNMQIVSSLLNLQSESVDDENTRQILKKSQNRIKSMALVHEKLYQTEDLSSVDFGEYTRSLTTRLLHSFGETTRGVQLVIDMDEVCLDVNKAIPCGLIINEIVTNSFKHAFPDSTTGVDKNKFEVKGVIKVSMCKNADPESRTSADVETLAQTAGRSSASAEIAPGQAGTVELVVGDNGVGLPEGLDFRKTKTLGMELVVTLVDQLEGSIEYANNGGAEFKITFEV